MMRDRGAVPLEEGVGRVEVNRRGDQVVGPLERLLYRDAGLPAVDVHLVHLVAGTTECPGEFSPAVDGIQHQDLHGRQGSSSAIASDAFFSISSARSGSLPMGFA